MMEKGGTSPRTTAPAAITHPLPTWQPSKNVTFAPTQQSSSTVIPFLVTPCIRIGMSVREKL
jgi:hypothetical protein